MMRTLYECETEIGRCDYAPDEVDHFHYAEPDYARVVAHTKAHLNGEHGMLKIEQHCFLRHGSEVPDQPWIKPKLMLEPALETEDEMVALAKTVHDQFVVSVRIQFPQEYLA